MSVRVYLWKDDASMKPGTHWHAIVRFPERSFRTTVTGDRDKTELTADLCHWYGEKLILSFDPVEYEMVSASVTDAIRLAPNDFPTEDEQFVRGVPMNTVFNAQSRRLTKLKRVP